MALDGDLLGDQILAAVNGVPQPPTDRTAVFRAIGKAIVDHIKANAELGTLVFFAGIGAATLAYVPPTAVPAPPAPPATNIPLMTLF